MVRALPYGRDPVTCPPWAFLRWRRPLLSYTTDGGGRSAALTQLPHPGLTSEHVCRSTGTTVRRGDGGDADLGAAGLDLSATSADSADGGGGEGWLVPTVHKTGRVGGKALTGDAVAAMIQRRALGAGFTPAQIDLLGGHSLRSGFVTEAFRAGADAQSIMRQTGHKDPKMLEVYAPLMGNAVLEVNL